MPLCVIGSVAFDSVETPSATRENVLGGSAVYFAYAAGFFTTVRLAGVVGEDWPAELTEMLSARGIDTAGLRVVQGGKTFRWRGKYLANMNDRETLDLQLNVLGDCRPMLPDEYCHCPFLFLANGSPTQQLEALDQCQGARFVVADTMDHYIRGERAALMQLMKRIDGLVLNDSEARLLTDDDNLVRAGRTIRRLGPQFVVVKKGEHGAMYFGDDEMFVLPAYPTETVVDPTGAGDSFAGGMMGYLAEAAAKKGTIPDQLSVGASPNSPKGAAHKWGPSTFATAAETTRITHDSRTMKKALAYGTLMASFTVEDFSLDRLRKISRKDLDKRMQKYRRMFSF
jgi:sugar/nucleoside kinase (ribokinase family)